MRGFQTLSIVVPVYRGASYLGQLVAEIARLRETLQQEGSPILFDRAIFVDDGAVDDSPVVLDRLAATHSWIEVLHLARNSGQHVATAAGLAHSHADWIATLDEDLQHRPEHLLDLLTAASSSSADLAYAAPRGSVHRTFYRDLSSRTAKRWISLLSGNPNVRHINSFRLVRGPVARAAAGLFESGTYLDIALFWFTSRVVAVPVALVDRRDLAGEPSGYGFLALTRHALRMIASSWSGPPPAGESTPGRGRGGDARSLKKEIAIDRSRDAELRDFLTSLPRSAGETAGDAC